MQRQNPQHTMPYGVTQAEFRAAVQTRRASDLRERMRNNSGFIDYICAVNAILIPIIGHNPGPLLTDDEKEAMGDAFDRQEPAGEFAKRIEMAREAMQEREPSFSHEDLAARNALRNADLIDAGRSHLVRPN